MVKGRKIIERYGDVNPIDYGGGCLVRTAGHPPSYDLEYTHGLESVSLQATEGEFGIILTASSGGGAGGYAVHFVGSNVIQAHLVHSFSCEVVYKLDPADLKYFGISSLPEVGQLQRWTTLLYEIAKETGALDGYTRTEVLTLSVETQGDLLEWYGAQVHDIASCIGIDPQDLQRRAKSRKLTERARVLEDISYYTGWESLGADSHLMTVRSLEKRWEL